VPVAVPYHSPRVEPLRDEFLASLADLTPRPAQIPVASSTLGGWAFNGYGDNRYWWRNIRETVQFASAVDLLIQDECETFVEIGAHPVLRSALAECLQVRGKSGTIIPSLRRGEDDGATMRQSLGRLYSLGCNVNWEAALGPQQVCSGLPQYPWRRERHWLGPEFQIASSGNHPGASETGHPLLGIRLRSARPCWEADLRDPKLAYFRGHAVEDGAVFPAAAYLEMAVAAFGRSTTNSEGVVLDEVVFHKMLPIPEGAEPLVQLIREGENQFTARQTASGMNGRHTLRAGSRARHPRAQPPFRLRT
jgi:acyl transferase domain-containing protein